jgi:hypothetical protein
LNRREKSSAFTAALQNPPLRQLAARVDTLSLARKVQAAAAQGATVMTGPEHCGPAAGRAAAAIRIPRSPAGAASLNSHTRYDAPDAACKRDKRSAAPLKFDAARVDPEDERDGLAGRRESARGGRLLEEGSTMWRAVFLSLGIFLMVVGAECLAVDTAYLRLRDDPPPQNSPIDAKQEIGPQKTLTPAPWTPWSLMSSGAVVCLYSFTIPRRVAGK